MSWWKRAISGGPTNVIEGDLAEFTHGVNKGKRLIVEAKCLGLSDAANQVVWHVHPLMSMAAQDSIPWTDGYLLGHKGMGVPHAKDRDLRKVPPEDLDKADPRDVAAPKDDLEKVGSLTEAYELLERITEEASMERVPCQVCTSDIYCEMNGCKRLKVT